MIFICEVAGGIAAYLLRGDLNYVVAESMKKAMINYNETGYEGVTQTWDYSQHEVQLSVSQVVFFQIGSPKVHC